MLRVPTRQGDVWFKASGDGLRRAAVTAWIAARRPDAVPPLLAADTTAGWMLMTDAGESLRTVVPREQSLDRWYDVLPLYAGVQLDLADDVDELLALGVPDMRLAAAEGLRAADGRDRCRPALPRRGAAGGRPVRRARGVRAARAAQHDDLHDGQVFVRDDRPLLMDWGDVCISHPFFTLSVTLQGVLAWGLEDVQDSVDVAPFRDAYLAPAAERFDGDLVAATEVAMRLGWACRAVNGHVPSDHDHVHPAADVPRRPAVAPRRAGRR